MLKKLLVTATLLTISNAHAAVTSAGDLAFTAFNADEDGWAITTFVDIAANSSIYFSDNEWNGSAIGSGGAFIDANEGNTLWTTGASQISAGSVIRFSNVDKASRAVTVGSITTGTLSSTIALGNSNETIYAFLGSSGTTPTTFLAAITNGNFTTPTDGVLTGTGLVQGTNAIRLNANNPAATPDYAEYNGVRTGLSSLDAYKPLVADVTNWTVDTTNGVYTTTIPNTTAFSAPVPEPETYGMLLVGLGFIGFISRRKFSI
jgi:PEP-CTERM motif